MRTRAIWVLFLAIICGGSAAVGMSRLRQPGATAPVETTGVLGAHRDIPRGSMLTEDMVETKEWPQGMLPKKALQKVEDIVGRAAAVPIVAGDLVTETKLASKDAGRGVAALIPAGMRAYTIQTSK